MKLSERNETGLSNRVQTGLAIATLVLGIPASIWYANDLLRAGDDQLVDQATIDVMEDVINKHKDRLED